MPFRNGKIAGVLNDSSTNEMSYVDMHDLHPENVQAAEMHGAMSGAAQGATLASIPAAIVAFFSGSEIKTVGEEVQHVRFTGKNLGIAAAIIAAGAVVMGAVRSYTAKKDAETHNTWSERVLSRMEEREAAEAKLHAAAITTQREQPVHGAQSADR